MSNPSSFERFLFLTAQALGPYVNRVVFAGGTASFLYHRHPLARRIGFPPTMTSDVDIVTWNPMQKGDSESLLAFNAEKTSTAEHVSERLKQSGFEEVVTSTPDGHGEIQRFFPQDPLLKMENFHLEFLCPLRGSGQDRITGRAKVSVDVQPNLMAQTLRYVDLLLMGPLSISIGDHDGNGSYMTILVPHPIAYIAQKYLIQPERIRQGGDKYEKDCYYIFEAAALFRGEQSKLISMYSNTRSHFQSEQLKWIQTFSSGILQDFSSENSKFVLALMGYAKRIGRDISPSQIIGTLDWVSKSVT